jgi:hypothetical protein
VVKDKKLLQANLDAFLRPKGTTATDTAPGRWRAESSFGLRRSESSAVALRRSANPDVSSRLPVRHRSEFAVAGGPARCFIARGPAFKWHSFIDSLHLAGACDIRRRHSEIAIAAH